VTLLGGLILLASANRLTASFGAWLGVACGAWFAVGPQLAGLLHIGSPGTPASTNSGLRALESLAFFYGLGALIIFFAAGALGRLSVLSVRDVRFARRREAAAAEARAAEDRAAARRAQRAEQDRSAGSRDARQREDVQNDSHAHRHFGFRRGASTEGDRSPQAQQDTRLPQGQQPGREQQDPGYQPAHLDERSSGARSSNDR
jgi:hypothetical protein